MASERCVQLHAPARGPAHERVRRARLLGENVCARQSSSCSEYCHRMKKSWKTENMDREGVRSMRTITVVPRQLSTRSMITCLLVRSLRTCNTSIKDICS